MTHTVTCSIMDMDQTVPGAGAVSTGTIPAQHSAVPQQHLRLQAHKRRMATCLCKGATACC